FDVVSSAIIFLGYSIPAFAMGVLLLVLFGGGSFWDVIPLGGFRPDNWEELTFVQKIIGQLKHTIAPLLCYLIGSFATLTMLMKNSLLENLGLDYVRTAFAKGLPEKKVVLKHAVRNSLIPIATGLGHFIGIFLTGSYLLEKVFNIHGIGLLGFEAVLGSDYPLIMGSLVISIVILLLGNLISDLLYVAVDPRIKFN
nr:ABC transporter permease subunit [Chitinophagales bacterium]